MFLAYIYCKEHTTTSQIADHLVCLVGGTLLCVFSLPSHTPSSTHSLAREDIDSPGTTMNIYIAPLSIPTEMLCPKLWHCFTLVKKLQFYCQKA